MGVSPVEEAAGVLRGQPDGTGVVGDGLLQITLFPIAIAPPVVGFGPVRFEPDGLREVGDGLVELALPPVGPAAVLVGRVRSPRRARWRG